MAEYWGATADPNYGYSPYSGQLHYTNRPSSSEPFTKEAGEDNPMTIEEIQMRIHNMHPERMAALADQWENAGTLMSNVRTYVLQQSNVLHDEHWNSPEARDAFLRKGPGEALAYLDVWMEAVQKNVTALRHLVLVAQDAREAIDDLVDRYERELAEDAQNVGLRENAGAWITGLTITWDEAKDREIHENVEETTKRFQLEAQGLAHDVGNQYYEYTSTVISGAGPPYRPMNVVLNRPGMPPTLNLPNRPPGAARAAPPPIAPVPPPSATPPPLPGGPSQLTGELVTAPPTPPPAALPAPPPGVLPPGVLPPGLRNTVQPAPPPGLAPGPPAPLPAPPPGLQRTMPGAVPGQTPGTLPPGAGQGSPSAAPPPSPPRGNPGQMGRNAFGERSAQPPGAGQPPGRTLRRSPARPGAPEAPGAKDLRRGTEQPGQPGTPPPGRTAPSPPGRGGQRRAGEPGDRQPGDPVGGDEAFARPPASTAPPVLKNPSGDRNRIRPGSREELRPAAHAGSGDGGRPDGTTSPVLSSPARPGPAAPTPAQRRADAARSRRRQAAEHGSEWIGAQEARADAGASVLDAPTPPPTGSRVSRLEEVPKELRGRAAKKEPTTGRPARPGAVSPELSKRRTDDRTTAAESDEEARGIVTDEQAFEVQTPGGGVVTSRRDEPVYEPEQRRALGGRD